MTIRKYFDKSVFDRKITENNGEALNVVFDTTIFDNDISLMLFRGNSKNLHWKFVDSETVENYRIALMKLKEKYYFLSFTIDGRKGVIKMLERELSDIPIQLCRFHQFKTITRYITRKPKTECGKEIKCLMLDLPEIDKFEFTNRFLNICVKYDEYLKEKNDNNQFKHRNLRSAVRSIKTNLKYLFTNEEYPDLKIPTTTNSCDGYFSHLKAKVNLHRGIAYERKKMLIEELLNADLYKT